MSSEKQKLWWPRYLKSPVQILYWEADELAPMLLGLVFSIIIKSIFPLILGIGTTILLVKLKRHLPRGFLYNVAYLVGLHRIKRMPYYVQKDFKK